MGLVTYNLLMRLKFKQQKLIKWNFSVPHAQSQSAHYDARCTISIDRISLVCYDGNTSQTSRGLHALSFRASICYSLGSHMLMASENFHPRVIHIQRASI
jgi:hypothetical protein